MKQPLVSVGIPTYNRPDGLRRTLACITGQKYKNLEIIVSDNASPGVETEKVVREVSVTDPRIQYHKQPRNMGPFFNFFFVLKQATGEYFMWAADDDEWDKDFITECESNIGKHNSVMTGFTVINRYKKTEVNYLLPEIDVNKCAYENIKAHLLRLTPNLLYGLHRRKAILWVLDEKTFDWWDCFFITRMLIDGKGIVLIKDYSGFRGGIDTENYTVKPSNPGKNRALTYKPVIMAHIKLIVSADKRILGFFQKLKLIALVLKVWLRQFSHFESDFRPIETRVVKLVFGDATIRSRLYDSYCWLRIRLGKYRRKLGFWL